MSLYGYKPKTKPALWKQLLPSSKTLCEVFAKEERDQQRALAKRKRDTSRIVNKLATKTVRKRIAPVSKAKQETLKTYSAFRAAHLAACPKCVGCRVIFKRDSRPATDIHHSRGRLGTLLTDTRWWFALCRECHDWVGANPDAARVYGLLCGQGSWNRSACPTCSGYARKGDQCASCVLDDETSEELGVAGRFK